MDEVLALIPSAIERPTNMRGSRKKKNKNKAAGELEHILINDDQGSRYSYGKL